ncbi:MAG: DUF4058 family protein [Armatimonadaceae bacterium]
MPLHDWTDRDNFDALHHMWIAELVVLLRHTLPPPYQVMLGTNPRMTVGSTRHNPDVGVANGRHSNGQASGAYREPDVEVMVAPLEEDLTVQVARNGRLVAAIELISPGNKDRPDSRDYFATRYLNYLRDGVHLLLVDVHRRPSGFSFPQLMSERLATPLPAPPAPSVVAYRVGESMKHDGRLLAVWAEPLTVGQPLPAVSLPLTVHLAVPIDLEGTYSRAADNCYLE